MVLPVCAEDQRAWRAWRMDDSDAPDENPDFQIRPFLDKRSEERAERRRILGTGIRAKADAAIEIPPNNED